MARASICKDATSEYQLQFRFIVMTNLHEQPQDEQNGCRQRLVWHLSCHRRLPLAVA
jgi:hypothetical protein